MKTISTGVKVDFNLKKNSAHADGVPLSGIKVRALKREKKIMPSTLATMSYLIFITQSITIHVIQAIGT